MSTKEPYRNLPETVKGRNNPFMCAVETFNILGIRHYGPPLATPEKNRNILADWFDTFPQRHTLLKNYIPEEKLLFGVDGCGAQVEGGAAKIAEVERMWKKEGLETLIVSGECLTGNDPKGKATYLLHYRSGRASLAVFKPSPIGNKDQEEYDNNPELRAVLSDAEKSSTVFRDRASQTAPSSSSATRRRRTRTRSRTSTSS